MFYASYVLIELTSLLTVSDQYNQDVAHWSLAVDQASACSVAPGTAEDVGKIVCLSPSLKISVTNTSFLNVSSESLGTPRHLSQSKEADTPRTQDFPQQPVSRSPCLNSLM